MDAKQLNANLDAKFTRRLQHESARAITQTLVLVEEAGEVAQAVRRFEGLARRWEGKCELAEELADVIITTQVLAEMYKIDLDEAVARKYAAIKERGGV